MPQRCKICSSQHRPEIEDLRLNKKAKYVDILQIIRNKHNEEVSYSSLSRHFNNCVQQYLDSSIKSDKLRQIYVKEKIRENINACVNLINTINMLNEQLVTVRGHMDDPEARKEAREIAKILDDVMRTTLQYSDKLKIEEDNATDRDVYDRLLWTLEQACIPVEYIQAIKDKWELYGKQSNN